MIIKGLFLKASKMVLIPAAIAGTAVGYGLPAVIDAADDNGLEDAIPDSVRDFNKEVQRIVEDTEDLYDDTVSNIKEFTKQYKP